MHAWVIREAHAYDTFIWTQKRQAWPNPPSTEVRRKSASLPHQNSKSFYMDMLYGIQISITKY